MAAQVGSEFRGKLKEILHINSSIVMTEEQHGRHSNGIVKDESSKNQNSAKTAQSLTKFAVQDNNSTEERDSNCNCLPKTNTDSLSNTKSVVVETHF